MLRDRLIELAIALAIAEEIRTTERVVERVVEVGEVGRAVGETKTIDLSNVRVPNTVVSIRGDGILSELSIVSPSKDFRVTVRSGERNVLNVSWDDVSRISQFVSWLDAVYDQETGKYSMVVRDVQFKGLLQVVVEPLTTTLTSLDRVLAKVVIFNT